MSVLVIVLTSCKHQISGINDSRGFNGNNPPDKLWEATNYVAGYSPLLKKIFKILPRKLSKINKWINEGASNN